MNLLSHIETRQIQAKAMAWFRVLAAFAYPSLDWSKRFEVANADNRILCYSATGFCVADVVCFSTPHQRSGKSGNGDSGKRNEDDFVRFTKYALSLGFFIFCLLILISTLLSLL